MKFFMESNFFDTISNLLMEFFQLKSEGVLSIEADVARSYLLSTWKSSF